MKMALLAGVVATLIVSAPASADDFYFSFQGDQNHPGSVSGEVFGLQNNSTSSAASRVDVTISSIDGFSPQEFSLNGLNTFGEQNGAVTQANFAGESPDGYDLTLDVGDGSALRRGNAEVSYTGIFSGLTFTPAISDAPEPSTWALMFMGAGVLGLMLRRRRSVGMLATT